MQPYFFIGGYQDGLSWTVPDDAESIQMPVGRTPDVKATVSRIRVFNETPPSAAPMGTPEPDIIQSGYAFLRQYKTVWDFSERKIYLLNP